GATGRASWPTGLGSTSSGSVLAADRGDDRYPAGQRTSLGSAVLGAPAVGARTAVELLDEHGTVLASAPLPAPETLPAVRPAAPPPPPVTGTCRCGNVTARGHAGFTCAEVLAIRARVDYGRLPWRKRLRTPAPDGWRVDAAAIVERDRQLRELARARAEAAALHGGAA